MKKIYVCLAFLTLLGFSGFAEKNTKIVALECNAGMFLTYGISANLDFNFGSFFAANGLTLHASFIWDTHNWFVLFYEDQNQWEYSGIGAKLGLRYFFGESGLDGFFLGLLCMANLRVEQPSSSQYGTGKRTTTLWVLGEEVGYRFLFFDYMTLTLGIYTGIVINEAGEDTLDAGYEKGNNSLGWNELTYTGFTIAFGFAL